MTPIRIATYSRVAADGRRARLRLARDQQRLAAVVASWPGYVQVAGYADAGPFPAFGRRGLNWIMLDAAAGRIDLVVVDHLDQLTGDRRQLQVLLGRLAAARVGVYPLVRRRRRRLVAAATSAAIVELAALL